MTVEGTAGAGVGNEKESVAEAREENDTYRESIESRDDHRIVRRKWSGRNHERREHRAKTPALSG
jgi:hypothetical protein